MIVTLYTNEYDPKYILCTKCGRYVRINSDCDCELLDSISRKNSDIVKRYNKGDIKNRGTFYQLWGQISIDLIYLDEWLADPSKPKLLLVGEPGSGKTAIAGRLYQFSKREVTPLEDLKYIGKGFINAIHFCSTTYRNNPWINSNSTIFVESLAMQLAEFFPKYAKALNEISGDRQAQINVEQHIQTVGNVIGNIIENIDLRSASY